MATTPKTEKQLRRMSAKTLMDMYPGIVGKVPVSGEKDDLIADILAAQESEFEREVDAHQDAMDRAESGQMDPDEAEELGITLEEVEPPGDDDFVDFESLGIPDAPVTPSNSVKVDMRGKYAKMTDDEVVEAYTKLIGEDQEQVAGTRDEMIAFIRKMTKRPASKGKASKGLRTQLEAMDDTALEMKLQELYDEAGDGKQVEPGTPRSIMIGEIAKLSRKSGGPRTGRRYTTDQVLEMRQLRADGKSFAEIGKMMTPACSGMFVRNVCVGNLYKDIPLTKMTPRVSEPVSE